MSEENKYDFNELSINENLERITKLFKKKNGDNAEKRRSLNWIFVLLARKKVSGKALYFL